MFKSSKLALVLFLLSAPAWCQYVTVTGTIVDQNGCPYANGTASAVLVPSNVQYYFGNNPATNIRPVWQLDSFGHFSIQLYETDLLSPTNPAPQWQFRFNSAPIATPIQYGTINFTMQPISLLTSQDISALATAQSAPIPPGCGQVVNGGPPLNCASSVVGANIYLLTGNPQALGCDPLMIDNAGTMTGLQFNAVSPWNGELKVTAVNTGPPQALPANSTSWVAPNVIPTKYRNVLPSTPCTPAQIWQVQSITTDGTGTTNQNWNCGNGPGNSQVIQVNGTPIITESPANFQNGTGITITNPSAGNILISTGATQLSNPVAPTVTPLGTTGATTYCYVILGNENGLSTVHSAATSAGCTNTGNASLVSTGCPTACTAANQLSAYIDTTYGYRCADVYRTQGGASTGKIATCVDKTFIDTGLAGDSTTAPATNTTATIQTMNPTSGGCNYPSGSPQGIDGLPCTPNAFDDEYSSTHGIGGINDNFWLPLNPNGATYTLTGGLVSISNAHQASNQLNCLIKPLPSAPYTFVGLAYPQFSVQQSNNGWLSVGLYESSSGRLITLDFLNTTLVTTSHWTTASSFSANVANNTISYANSGVYWQIARSGTTLSMVESADGIVYPTAYTETLTTWFTTAPDNLAICVNPRNGNTVNMVADFDYVRRTQ